MSDDKGTKHDVTLTICNRRYGMSYAAARRLGDELIFAGERGSAAGVSAAVAPPADQVTQVEGYDWELLRKWEGENGHGYYRDNVSGRIGVSGRSGGLPDEMCSGVLFLDLSTDAKVHSQPENGRWWVPVLDAHGCGTRIQVDVSEAFWIAKTFGRWLVLPSEKGDSEEYRLP